MLGLATRAGKVTTGEELVLQMIRGGRSRLVILATDTAPNTEKKILNKSSYYQVPCYRFGGREALGKAVGKENRVVLSVNDSGFAKKMMVMLEDFAHNKN